MVCIQLLHDDLITLNVLLCYPLHRIAIIGLYVKV